jgi:hypothetical protein
MQILEGIADGWTGMHRGQRFAEINCGDRNNLPLKVHVEYSVNRKLYRFKGKLDGKLMAVHELPEYKIIERKVNNAT